MSELYSELEKLVNEKKEIQKMLIQSDNAIKNIERLVIDTKLKLTNLGHFDSKNIITKNKGV
jgi:hypothetical protein